MLNLRIFDLLVPILVILMATLYLPITVLLLLKDRRNLHLLTHWSTFQRAWFARFWEFFGVSSKFLFVPDVEPLVTQSAQGSVLDVGCGSGDWVYLFSPARNSKIKKVLLLEPNANFHETLRARAEKVGLSGKYEIVDGGVEDLERKGVKPGSVDTVVTVHVLCSVSQPEDMVRRLYECLKPGGNWVVYEHVVVKNRRSLAGIFQVLVNTIWPVFLDGCTLTRDTEALLRGVGKWESFELQPGVNQGRFSQLPHIRGVLVKANAP